MKEFSFISLLKQNLKRDYIIYSSTLYEKVLQGVAEKHPHILDCHLSGASELRKVAMVAPSS